MSCSIHYRVVSPNANRIPGHSTEWGKIREVFYGGIDDEIELDRGSLLELRAMAAVSDWQTWPALIEAIETHGSIRLYLEC